jgi:hypothetical protein
MGPYSASVNVTTPPTGVPAVPTALMANAVGTQTVELDWMAPAGTIVGYKIQRSTSTPANWVDVIADTGNKNVYYSDTHSSLAGKSVRYRVAASNSVGMGVYATHTDPADVTLPKAGTQPGASIGWRLSTALAWAPPLPTAHPKPFRRRARSRARRRG